MDAVANASTRIQSVQERFMNFQPVAAGAIEFELQADVARVAICHHSKFNAMSRAMWRQLRAVFDSIQLNPEVRCVLVARELGLSVARQMLLEAATFSAADMKLAGFISRVLADGELAADAQATARRIAALAPQAARLNKQAIRAS